MSVVETTFNYIHITSCYDFMDSLPIMRIKLFVRKLTLKMALDEVILKESKLSV